MDKGGNEMPRTIEISVANGTLICTPDEGNVLAPAGEAITWERGAGVDGFVLRFYKAPMLGNAATDNWPFSNGSSPSAEPVPRFEGTLNRPGGVYKYTIEARTKVQTYFLDPMIIVSK